MDDYTSEFNQLMAWNEFQDREEQLVARYFGGLRIQIQDTVKLFDPISVFVAH